MTVQMESPVTKSESERVEDWREHQLLQRGYAPKEAAEIAKRTDIDLHFAVELLDLGCPPELAPRILL